MRWRFVVLVISSLAVLGAAASARSQPQSHDGIALTVVSVGIKGWGSVTMSKGVRHRGTFSCTNSSCPANTSEGIVSGHRVVLIEKPYKGWKFTGWRGACKRAKRRSRCVIKVAQIRPSVDKTVAAGTKFVPVAPGLTRAHPLPIRTAANVAGGFRVRVNSVMANAQLSPPAAAGTEYFAASLTVGFIDAGSAAPSLAWNAIGRDDKTYVYGINAHGCPSPGPQPALDLVDPIPSGKSITGYVCWRVATNDTGDLELYLGTGTFAYPGTTWFALR